MPHPKVKLSDDSGNTVSVTGNKLDVNATIQAGDFNVGNVDIHLNGGVPLLGGDGDVAPGVLRVTLADDDSAVTQLVNISGNFKIVGESYGSGNGLASLAFRQDVLGASFSGLGIANNDWTYLQVNSKGGLYVTGSEVENAAVQSQPILAGGRYDSSARTLGNGDAGAVALNASGHVLVAHAIAGGADGVTTVSSAGTDVVLGGDVACKKIDIQAQTDNTGLIAVGFTGVDATEATGTGVILYAGDTYSLETGNLNLIYIDSTVSGDGVRYTYFT